MKINLFKISWLVFATIMLSACGRGFRDQEGNRFRTVKIGHQEWMAENLDVSHFRNGDPIPEAGTDEKWKQAGQEGQPAWCYFDNDPGNGKKYGRLYNWYAVTDPRGLAPEGWHIPDENEWKELVDTLGGVRVAGIRMKSADGWACGGNGTNESGFKGLPGGIRIGTGAFDYLEYYGYWWSTTELRPDYAHYHYLYCFSDKIFGYVNYLKQSGFSVRCLRDQQRQ